MDWIGNENGKRNRKRKRKRKRNRREKSRREILKGEQREELRGLLLFSFRD